MASLLTAELLAPSAALSMMTGGGAGGGAGSVVGGPAVNADLLTSSHLPSPWHPLSCTRNSSLWPSTSKTTDRLDVYMPLTPSRMHSFSLAPLPAHFTDSVPPFPTLMPLEMMPLTSESNLFLNRSVSGMAAAAAAAAAAASFPNPDAPGATILPLSDLQLQRAPSLPPHALLRGSSNSALSSMPAIYSSFFCSTPSATQLVSSITLANYSAAQGLAASASAASAGAGAGTGTAANYHHHLSGTSSLAHHPTGGASSAQLASPFTSAAAAANCSSLPSFNSSLPCSSSAAPPASSCSSFSSSNSCSSSLAPSSSTITSASSSASCADDCKQAPPSPSDGFSTSEDDGESISLSDFTSFVQASVRAAEAELSNKALALERMESYASTHSTDDLLRIAHPLLPTDVNEQLAFAFPSLEIEDQLPDTTAPHEAAFSLPVDLGNHRYHTRSRSGGRPRRRLTPEFKSSKSARRDGSGSDDLDDLDDDYGLENDDDDDDDDDDERYVRRKPHSNKRKRKSKANAAPRKKVLLSSMCNRAREQRLEINRHFAKLKRLSESHLASVVHHSDSEDDDDPEAVIRRGNTPDNSQASILSAAVLRIKECLSQFRALDTELKKKQQQRAARAAVVQQPVFRVVHSLTRSNHANWFNNSAVPRCSTLENGQIIMTNQTFRDWFHLDAELPQQNQHNHHRSAPSTPSKSHNLFQLFHESCQDQTKSAIAMLVKGPVTSTTMYGIMAKRADGFFSINAHCWLGGQACGKKMVHYALTDFSHAVVS